MERPLLLFSGGVDSALVLWRLRAAGLTPHLLSFDYPGRPRGERRAALSLARRVGLPAPERINLPFLRENDDLPPALREPRAGPGYVPSRNALFYSLGYHRALVLGCDALLGGHNADDAARFPDAGPAWLSGLEDQLRAGAVGGRGPRILAPLSGLAKRDVLLEAEVLGIPLDRTWSCYEDEPHACGRCPACRERALAPVATT